MLERQVELKIQCPYCEGVVVHKYTLNIMYSLVISWTPMLGMGRPSILPSTETELPPKAGQPGVDRVL